MIVQVITVRLIQTQNHGNLRPADGAPTVGGEIWCSFLSTNAFLLGNGQTYATRGVPYYRVSRIFMSRIFSVPRTACIVRRQHDGSATCGYDACCRTSRRPTPLVRPHAAAVSAIYHIAALPNRAITIDRGGGNVDAAPRLRTSCMNGFTTP